MAKLEDFKIERISDGSFRVTRTDVANDKHTHMLSKQLAQKVIYNVCNNRIPLDSSTYALISMLRLSTNEKYSAKLQDLLSVRKQKGKKEKFYRPN